MLLQRSQLKHSDNHQNQAASLSPKNFGISQTKQGNLGLNGCFL